MKTKAQTNIRKNIYRFFACSFFFFFAKTAKKKFPQNSYNYFPDIGLSSCFHRWTEYNFKYVLDVSKIFSITLTFIYILQQKKSKRKNAYFNFDEKIVLFFH